MRTGGHLAYPLILPPSSARYLLRDGGLIDFHCAQLSHPPTHWQIFFTRTTLPIASQSISRDVPLARARFLGFSPLCPKGSSQTFLPCAHRTSTFLSYAFCEQEGWSGGSPFPSQGARSGSTGPVWVPPAYPFHRARSASKKSVARAQKIIRLHPLRYSTSKRTARLPFPSFSADCSSVPGRASVSRLWKNSIYAHNAVGIFQMASMSQ
jgi:hypothetical protein